uniref:integrin alpha-L-like n=1 Tax=Styela clava TaxID=7725 RepID=UPI00193AAE8E|nr:integrin alpha-L-like [Styela clava]
MASLIKVFVFCCSVSYYASAFNLDKRVSGAKFLPSDSYRELAYHLWEKEKEQANVLKFNAVLFGSNWTLVKPTATLEVGLSGSGETEEEKLFAKDIRIRYGCELFNASATKCSSSITLTVPSSTINLTSNGKNSIAIKSNDEKSAILICQPRAEQFCESSSYSTGACYLTTVNHTNNKEELFTDTPAWKEITPCWKSCYPTIVDLAFVVDGSSSVKKKNFERVLNWMEQIVQAFDVTQSYQIAVVKYARKQKTKVEIQLGQYKTHESLRNGINQIQYNPGGSQSSYAINLTINDVFNGPNGRFPNARRIMLFLTDGKSSDSSLLESTTNYARQNDVEAFAVGIAQYKMKELLMIAGDPSRVFTEKDYDNLPNTISKLQRGIRALEGGNKISQNMGSGGLDQCSAGMSSIFGRKKVKRYFSHGYCLCWSTVLKMCLLARMNVVLNARVGNLSYKIEWLCMHFDFALYAYVIGCMCICMAVYS